MSRWRLAALGAAGVGVTYLGLRTAFDDDFDLYNVGAARFVSLEYTPTPSRVYYKGHLQIIRSNQ